MIKESVYTAANTIYKMSVIKDLFLSYESALIGQLHIDNLHTLQCQDIRSSLTHKNYEFLDIFKKQVGLYFAINNDKPVYIGIGGTGKEDDLKKRIKDEHRIYEPQGNKYNNATLSKNIQRHHHFADSDPHIIEHTAEIFNRLELMVIVAGNMNDHNGEDNRKLKMQVMALERLFICFYDPIYNRY